MRRIGQRGMRLGQHRLQIDEAMHHIGMVGDGDGNPGPAQLFGIGQAFVMQRIVAAQQDIGGRQMREILGAQRRDQRRSAVGLVRRIFLVEPFNGLAFQEIAHGIFIKRRGFAHHLGVGKHQELEGELGSVPVARQLRHHRRQRAARRIAAHGDASGIDPQIGRVGGDPLRRGEGIVQRRGIRMLRREAVIDGDDAEMAFGADQAAKAVMAVEAADHEAAAMEEDQRRARLAAYRHGRIRAGGDPAPTGMVKFSIRPMATFCGPTSPIIPAKEARAMSGGICHILGRGIDAAWSRKAFTKGSSGMDILTAEQPGC